MMAPTVGLINAQKPKPPAPKASPKNFRWISPNVATEKDRQAFAAALQELLKAMQWTHATLAEKLWGRDKTTSRNIGKARDWIKGTGRYPTELEAAYIAQVLGVSMQRLTEPKTPFDPTATGFVRVTRPREEWNTKPKSKAKGNGLANGHDTDTRWLRPEGVAPVFMRFESSKKHPALVALEVKGDMPVEIAMAVMAMVGSKAADE